MRKIVMLLLLLFSLESMAQSYQENLEKYWDYRVRLKNDFIYFTGDPTINGSHQPIERRAVYNDENYQDDIDMGDATYNLGYYIGLLALEYKLLKDNGQDCDETLLELYYALRQA